MNPALTRKLEAAVTILTGHGALKDRLALAYSEHLEHLDQQAQSVEPPIFLRSRGFVSG